MPTGRFAPSPTGALHLGNLRTALIAWLSARSINGTFLVRMEDLDRVTSSGALAEAQLADLAALGLDWDGEVVFQSDRFELYEAAIARLDTYPCYCTRREIREAAAAPHGDIGVYPGTCRNLDDTQRAEHARKGRAPALRLRAHDETVTFEDRLLGTVTGVVDDVVLRRNDGVPAYNLAVVVDDAAQGVTEVVRGEDLASSTPRQIHLAHLLDLPVPEYAHVPLVLGPDGDRLAKRHGAVTLAQIAATPSTVVSMLAVGLSLAEPGEPVTAGELVDRFRWDRIPRGPWTVVS